MFLCEQDNTRSGHAPHKHKQSDAKPTTLRQTETELELAWKEGWKCAKRVSDLWRCE